MHIDTDSTDLTNTPDQQDDSQGYDTLRGCALMAGAVIAILVATLACILAFGEF